MILTNDNARIPEKALSKQTIAVFRVLVRENKMLSARRIALLTGISQQNIYRLVQPLVTRGLVTTGPVINVVYRARPKREAKNAYAQHAIAEFERFFGDAYEAQV